MAEAHFSTAARKKSTTKAQTTNHDHEKHKKKRKKCTNYQSRPHKSTNKTKKKNTNYQSRPQKGTKFCILEHNFFPPSRALGSPAGPEPLTLNPITLNLKPTDFRAVGRRFVLRPMSGLIFALHLQHPRSRGATG